ncbi:jg18478 [Pararge aegeria aegeria]|uniref:Jg18478 protein n=1 Tax=Pararge aegeria aegeria TaxID=348720 RepID=A0A8S4RLE4_9NEOP|nr:jg18478 [Pararge aegeria aegeria]
MTRRRPESPHLHDDARDSRPPPTTAPARDSTHQLPFILEDSASTESLTINLVITCENRRKEIANLSS